MQEIKHYITIKKASILKKCSRNSIYKLIEKGKINVIKVANTRYVIEDNQFREIEIANRGVPYSRLESRISVLEAKIIELTESNIKLQERIISLEGSNRKTKARKVSKTTSRSKAK